MLRAVIPGCRRDANQAPPRELRALLMAGLYRLHRPGRGAARGSLAAIGGPPQGPAEWLQAERLLWQLSSEARWRELTHPPASS